MQNNIHTHTHTHNQFKPTGYKFSIYYKAVLECETDSSETSSDVGSQETEESLELYIPHNIKFYEKHNFTAYLTPAKREIIADDDLCSLAASAIYNDNDNDKLTDKEYVEYECDDEFVCFEDGIEKDANEYLIYHGIPYRWSHMGSYAFAKWKNT